MSSPDTSARSAAPALRVAAFVAAGAVLTVLAAAAASVALVHAIQGSSSSWAALLLHRGPAKVTNRCLLLAAAALLPFLLRALRWPGWRETGLRPPALRGRAAARAAASAFGRGFLLAAPLLGGFFLAEFLLERRYLATLAADVVPWRRAAAYLASGSFVALAEETIVRGMLFLSLARRWRPVPAALATSVFFAWAHFLEPADAAFAAAGFGPATAAVFASTLANIARVPGAAPYFLNLTLVGLVLCALLTRARHLWVAIGAHAGWVWCIRLNVLLTVPSPEAAASAWFGARADGADAGLTTVLLAALLAGLAWAAAADRGGRHVLRLPAWSRWLLALAGAGAAAVLWFESMQDRVRPHRWGTVVEGTVYRSGQLSASLLEKTLRTRRIRLIVDLTDRKTENRHRDVEGRLVAELGLARVRAPLEGDGRGSLDSYVRAVKAMVEATRHGTATLVHCQSGTQRVGGVVAAYRLFVERRSGAEAYAELSAYGWRPERDQVLVDFLNEHLGELGRRLAAAGVIEGVPDPLPVLAPADAAPRPAEVRR